MNVEKQRIAIAEACGWKLNFDNPKCGWYWTNPDGFEVAWSDCIKPLSIDSCLPDYLSDLNAMHEAEKFLGKSIFLYSFELWRIVYGKDISLLEEYDEEGNCLAEGYEEQAVAAMIHATAAQKAEAFLKALKEWDE